MKSNLFLAPASIDGEAYKHLKKTVLEGIPSGFSEQIGTEDGEEVIRIWGLTQGLERTWKNAKHGDWIIFYTGNKEYKYAAQLREKNEDHKLGSLIRTNFLDVSEEEQRRGKKWELLLILDNVVEIDLDGDLLAEWLGYERAYRSRFQRVPQQRMDYIQNKFGSLDDFIDEFKT